MPIIYAVVVVEAVLLRCAEFININICIQTEDDEEAETNKQQLNRNRLLFN